MKDDRPENFRRGDFLELEEGHKNMVLPYKALALSLASHMMEERHSREQCFADCRSSLFKLSYTYLVSLSTPTMSSHVLVLFSKTSAGSSTA